ncbi:ELMO domain-containing protein 2 [Condylostylus longicornis]|uniref:ELMO domain-containing protein 2 n=1 Tax=Condylostylus longicornis TaxID=2530218 RepID=UPI00244E4147|nr:ELMO domain-containing protein 2 [Condylostylus longicornis]
MLLFTISNIAPLIYYYLRPFIKWFLHQLTRLCELQRLCYGAKLGSHRTRQVERSLQQSKFPAIKIISRELDLQVEYCNFEEFNVLVKRAVKVVMQAKRIKPQVHPDFGRLFGQCVEQIWGYRKLLFEIERLRTTQYDCENLDHERKLSDLWALLMPNNRLESRITKQWQIIGFQGDDPKTDFRGMGMLGLENLLYFAREYNDAARHVLSHSLHPTYGYTFAIVGINLTSMAYKLINSGKAKTHFYNVSKRAINITHFHRFYCYLFFEFDRFWVESNPRNIMDFPLIHQRFETNISIELEKENTAFKTNLVVESI